MNFPTIELRRIFNHCSFYERSYKVKDIQMDSLSKIANSALDEITNGQFVNLHQLAIAGLLNDFQYSWLERFKIPYKFEMLDIARRLCSGQNKAVFEATDCKSIEEIRNKFSAYIKKLYKNDDRIILSLAFDKKKINAEWIEMEKYLESYKTS